jgi:hypothetical protein
MAATEKLPRRDVSIVCEDGLPTSATIKSGGDPVSNVTRVDWSIEVGNVAKATVYCDVAPAEVKAVSARFLPAKETPFRARVVLAWCVLRGER